MKVLSITHKSNRICDNEHQYDFTDSSYVDPLGPLQERPKTSLRRKQDEDEFADDDIGDDLLPE